MADASIARRRVVLYGIAAASLAAVPQRWLTGGSVFAESASHPDVTQLARLLFPHDGLADDVYEEVAESVFDSLVTNPDSARPLDLADAALNAQVDGDWMAVGEARQIAALKSIDSEAYFGAILSALRAAFYNHPKVWAHIHYPGSSKEYGGYKQRGFDDIDWLPEIE